MMLLMVKDLFVVIGVTVGFEFVDLKAKKLECECYCGVTGKKKSVFLI